MKNYKINRLLSLAFVIAISFGFQSATINVGSIGDVKYSVLPLNQFQSVNGDGWVPLMGQDIQPDWVIGRELITFENNKLPDARGTFIRIVDEGAGRDAEQNRKVGTYQEDTFKKHSHTTVGHYQEYSLKGPGSVFGLIVGSDTHPTEPVGGDETRPKNIALYAYLKVK